MVPIKAADQISLYFSNANGHFPHVGSSFILYLTLYLTEEHWSLRIKTYHSYNVYIHTWKYIIKKHKKSLLE